jgi:hypothetical protein
MSDPLPAPSFNIPFSVAPTDISKGYAEGITQGGTSIAQALGSVSQLYTQNRNADDMLTAMQSNKMITPDEYEAVAGKSLGAKQQLLGMYATQWATDEAQQRALALQKGQGATTIGVEHAKLMDTINALRGGNPITADVKKMPYAGQQQQQQQQQPPPQPGQQITAPTPWAPGTKALQVKDTKTGNMMTAFQTPNGELRDQQGNLLQ